MTDWQTVRTDYEQGTLSQNMLAKKYGVSRTAIAKRATKEGWQVAGCRVQVASPPLPPAKVTPLPLPMDALSIARAGLRQLAQHLQNSDTLLDIRDHKSLSDALAQYVKVLVTAPAETAVPLDGMVIPLEKLSQQTRAALRRLLVEDEQARMEEETGS